MRKQKIPLGLIRTLLKSDTEDYFKVDCMLCGAVNSLQLFPNHVIEDEDTSSKLNIPTWICSSCDGEILEDSSIEKLLNYKAEKKGKKYIKYECKQGKVDSHNIH